MHIQPLGRGQLSHEAAHSLVGKRAKLRQDAGPAPGGTVDFIGEMTVQNGELTERISALGCQSFEIPQSRTRDGDFGR